jgi:hypothetical protein
VGIVIRTDQQRKALEVFCRELAEALNDAGLDMKKTLKPDIDIPWSQESVKDYLWRPIQEAMTGKHSSTDLDTVQPSAISDVLNRHLSEKFGIYVPWPSERG